MEEGSRLPPLPGPLSVRTGGGDRGLMSEHEAGRVRRFWEGLGPPGLVDVHTHFMPERVLREVWGYFDALGR